MSTFGSTLNNRSLISFQIQYKNKMSEFPTRKYYLQGLVVGVIASCTLLTIMMIGAQLSDIAKEPTLPVQMDGCSNDAFRNV